MEPPLPTSKHWLKYTPSTIPPLNYLSWTSGSAIPKGKQGSICKIVLGPQWWNELPPSPVQSSPKLSIAIQSLPPPTIVCYTPWHVMYALNVCCILYRFSSIVICVASIVVGYHCRIQGIGWLDDCQYLHLVLWTSLLYRQRYIVALLMTNIL